ncbi:hypothetical protein FBY10_111107 [Pseudomonas sp. SJZ103]|uniref:hypothetical protein n=1 Tax=unclassified Pseudomonas TaxID=196821 RepID=UPI0011A43198|nr:MULTISPECIES: hypothetical protein [unclassified Pseudomonas]TWC64952.1 hypothetical protein FBY10_111107 [Pseudomonas sp. SJZ103]TWC81874.1 hypothetical protein FBY08_112108 [Pseudomonas sp. SJZ094]
MELKSPSKNIRIMGCAGVIAGAAIIATNSEGFVHTFGVGILAGGLVLLVLPFFGASGRK